MEYNERDIEGPALIEFVKSHTYIESLLDVGAFYSYKTYAKELALYLDRYHAIDIDPDPLTEEIVDAYIVGNVLDHKGSYDCVSCISTIEHSGISSYKSDYKKERIKVFKKLLELSNKYVFLTFPYGLESFHENEFANITKEQLDQFISLCKNVTTTFYYSDNPQGKIPFTIISKSSASVVGYKKELGTRCICVMEIEK